MTFLCSTLLTLIIVPNSLWPSEMPARTGAYSWYMHYIWTISIQIKSERPYIRSGFEPSSIFFGRNVENPSQLNCVNESKWCIRIKMVHTPCPSTIISIVPRPGWRTRHLTRTKFASTIVKVKLETITNPLLLISQIYKCSIKTLIYVWTLEGHSVHGLCSCLTRVLDVPKQRDHKRASY